MESIFNYFNQKVNIFDVLDKFGIRYYGRTEQTIRCPSLLHVDSTPSAHIYPDSNAIKCYGCSKIFGVLNFYIELKGLSLEAAIRQASHDFNIPIRGLVKGKKQDKSVDMVGAFLNWLGPYVSDGVVQPMIEYVMSQESEFSDKYKWFVWAKNIVHGAMKTSDSVEEFVWNETGDDDNA